MTKKKTYNSLIHYDHEKQYTTKCLQPSQTKPDMALTIPEIMKRYASGRDINVKIYDEYSGDADNLTGVDIRTMDISEIHDLMNVSMTNLSRLKAETDQRRKKENDAALEASIIAKYEARKKKEIEDPGEAKFLQTKLPLDPK